MYVYKNSSDVQHKAMWSLSGMYIKGVMEEILDKNTILYPFLLSSNKNSRIYYALKKDEKTDWMSAIKTAIGYANIQDFYELKVD